MKKENNFFLQNFFFHKCKLCCSKLVYSKNHFNPTEIFVLRLFKIVTNQSAPCLNRGLSSNFVLLRSANNVKFIVECIICIENHVLVKKIFKNELKKSLPIQ